MILEDSLKTKWSKSKEFLFPLTGLPKDDRFDPKTYLFWGKYTIESYNLILTYNNEEGIADFYRDVIFPKMNDKCLIIENYDVSERVIFVIDLSYWADDIERFLIGKYSKFSGEAKKLIEKFHLLPGNLSPQHIFGTLYPNTKCTAFGDKTAIEYMSDFYGVDFYEIGEIASIYDRDMETLLTDIEDLVT